MPATLPCPAPTQPLTTVSWADQALTLLDADRRFGWRGLAPWLELNGQPVAWDTAEAEDTNGELTVVGRVNDADATDTLTVRPLDGGAVAIGRTLRNDGATPLTLGEVGLRQSTPDAGPVLGDHDRMRYRVWHPDHTRTERYPMCRWEAPLVRPIPLTPTRLGDSESQAIPALVVTHDAGTHCLVQGQLQQHHTRIRWHIAAAPTRAWGRFDVSLQAHGSSIRLMPGESIKLEPIFCQALQSTSIDQALDDYYRHVAASPGFQQRPANVLLHQAMYCTWNYGILRQIDHDSIANRARFIAERLPGIRFFLIDGGWVPWGQLRGPHLGNFHLGPEGVCDREKFPKGMKAIADEIRNAGLRPALHWTPFVNLGSPLAHDRADWLLRNRAGEPYRIAHFGYLDPSIPEVRTFIENDVLDVITKRWGFEAIKMDFWSQCVESQDAAYRHGGTGVQWRDWLLQAVRDRLPTDGFLMTCVAVSMGNPFLGKFAQTYRAGWDISNAASWWEHVRACCWTLPMLSQPGNQTCLSNMDGLGYADKLSHDENIHRLTWGMITMGSLEVDGRLETLNDEQLEPLKRLLAHPDRGHPCRCADDQAFTGEPLPRVLYVDYPEDSLTHQRGVTKHVALMNWSDHERWVTATAEQVGLSETIGAREFWTDTPVSFDGGHICRLLRPHAAELWEFSE